MVANDDRGVSTVVAVAILILVTVLAAATVGVGTRTVADDRSLNEQPKGEVPTGTAFSYHTYGAAVADVDGDRTPEFFDGKTLVVTKDTGPPIPADQLFIEVREASDPSTGEAVTFSDRWDRLDDGTAASYGNDSTVERHEGIAIDASDAPGTDQLSFAGSTIVISYQHGDEQVVLARLTIPAS